LYTLPVPLVSYKNRQPAVPTLSHWLKTHSSARGSFMECKIQIGKRKSPESTDLRLFDISCFIFLITGEELYRLPENHHQIRGFQAGCN
jgi:hypothetical protein